jgi:glycosyltransferase involved in cell wall biosynthesis
VRICLVSQEFPPDTARGGIGSQNWNKAHALAERGHDVHVLSAAARPGPDLVTEVIDGISVHRLQPPDAEVPVYEQPTFWVGYSWAVLRHLHTLATDKPFEVLDFAEYGAEGFAYQLDRGPWNWMPVVVQLHGPLAMFVERIGWPEAASEFATVGSFMEGLSIRRADALMACSENIADFTAECYGIDRGSIDAVHCGVDAGAFSPDPRDGPRPDGPVVLFAGNLADNKGLGTLVDAVLSLRPSYPGIRLRILGRGDDDLVASLLGRACDAGAEDALDFGGFVGDRRELPGEYRAADVFCSPAFHEVGVANVYIEAMACACPVVASTTGAAHEAVVDGSTGLLVPPGDSTATAAALDRILCDDALRRSMGAAGRRRVDDYFGMDRYIERVLAVYERAIEVSRARYAEAARAGGLEDVSEPQPARSAGSEG